MHAFLPSLNRLNSSETKLFLAGFIFWAGFISSSAYVYYDYNNISRKVSYAYAFCSKWLNQIAVSLFCDVHDEDANAITSELKDLSEKIKSLTQKAEADNEQIRAISSASLQKLEAIERKIEIIEQFIADAGNDPSLGLIGD